ncbi:UNVERIFIED_CONTAM: hypothetical protein Scaly_2653200 [Sesamum calycinum]|uniref:Uncharacterized protein n=1 Tax=Sesamum calycinum TaxID=2727403 RepID=A0AAW2JAH4_9LAMI
MTTCNKAQANTSRPEEARLRLPDPGHNLPRDGEPLASPFLASPSCLPSSCLSDSSSFLGSGISSLVGGFDSKELNVVRVHLSRPVQVQGRVIEGTQTLDLFSMAGGFFRIKSVLGRPGKTDWIERRCLCLFFIDRIPIIFSRRRRRQGRGCTYPRGCLAAPPISKGAYVLHSLPLNDEARSGRRDLNPQPQPWQGYALPLSYFRQRGKVKERSTTEQFTYHNIRMTSVFPPDHSLDRRSSYEHDSTSLLSMLGTGRFLSHSFSPLGWPLPATRTIDVTDQPHSSGQQLCSAFSADCQPVQLTSEDSSHPAQHLSSRRRLQSLSQGQATPEDQQPSPVASLPVASSDSGSLSQVRRSSQVSYPVEGF